MEEAGKASCEMVQTMEEAGKASCEMVQTMEEAGKASCKMVQRPEQFDSTSLNHADCIPNNTQHIKLVDAAAIESHQHDDHQKLKKYVGDISTPVIDRVTATKYDNEVSQDSPATCWSCSQKIMKGEVHVFSRLEGQVGRRSVLHHANCFMNLYPSFQAEKLAGWETLSASDQAAVLFLVKKVPPTAQTGIKDVGTEDRELQLSASKACAKRRKDVDGDQNLKVAKAEGDVTTSRAASAKNTNDLEPKLMAASTWSATESKEECEDKKEAARAHDHAMIKNDLDCSIASGGLYYKLFLLRKAWRDHKAKKLQLKPINVEDMPNAPCKAMAEASEAQCKRDDVDGDLELNVSTKARGEVTTISLESVKTANDLESKLEAESKELQASTEDTCVNTRVGF